MCPSRSNVDPDHPKVRALYERWGYEKVGHRQPFPDTPNFAVTLRKLDLVDEGRSGDAA